MPTIGLAPGNGSTASVVVQVYAARAPSLARPGAVGAFRRHLLAHTEVLRSDLNKLGSFKVGSAHETHEDLTHKGIVPERGPHLVESAGRTNVNLRDPDGRRVQPVDADRVPAQ